MVDYVSRKLKFKDNNDIVANLPRFIEFAFLHCEHPKFNWAEFVDTWISRKDGVVLTKYEDMRRRPEFELKSVVSELTGEMLSDERVSHIVDKYSFQSMKKASKDKKHGFVRKGMVGGWKDVFSAEAEEIFSAYGSEQLIALGYTESSRLNCS